jgi:hypothetical protein
MTQALYAHMNNKAITNIKKKEVDGRIYLSLLLLLAKLSFSLNGHSGLSQFCEWKGT